MYLIFSGDIDNLALLGTNDTFEYDDEPTLDVRSESFRFPESFFLGREGTIKRVYSNFLGDWQPTGIFAIHAKQELSE